MRPLFAFACAHLSDGRLYAAPLAVLQPRYDCRVFAICDHDSLREMAAELRAA